MTTTDSPGRSSLRRREALWGYLFLAPFIAGVLIWQAFPLLLSLYHSFTDYEVLTPPVWVGLRNYERMVGDLLLNAKVRGIRIFRVVTYLPSQLPIVASAFIFLWIFEPNFGIANYLLSLIGIEPQRWLFDPVLAKPTLAIMGIWGIGTGIIIFLAGLQGVPESLYDAAKVDGANATRQFIHVTLPMISPVLLFNLIIAIIGSFQVFDLAYLMTKGGPGTETLFYVLYIFRNAFELFKMGYASALAWVFFLVVLVLTFLNFRLSRRWVHYEVDVR